VHNVSTIYVKNDALINGLKRRPGSIRKKPKRYVLRYAQGNTQYVLTIRYKGKHLGTLGN